MSEQDKKKGRPPYPAEVRERAVRMVLDHQGGRPNVIVRPATGTISMLWEGCFTTSIASSLVLIGVGIAIGVGPL